MPTLNNGLPIPAMGLGTYKISNADGVRTLQLAHAAGYRLFDTASAYGNESTLGEALVGVDRADVFVVSKLGPAFHRPERVEEGVRGSLTRLGLEYVDLYLMHSPVGMVFGDEGLVDDGVSPVDTWLALEECYRKGLVRSIGVSNFSEAQLGAVLEGGGVRPAVHQFECSVGFREERMVRMCREEGVLVMAYRPLGKPRVELRKPDYLYEGTVVEVARELGKTPAQVALRFLIEEGFVPIPKSSNAERLKENLAVLDFKLDQETMERLRTSVVQHDRTATLDWLKGAKHYPF
ncbi:hypothetical protein pipiens_008751 [Culex pipiens pipiens]|uniref:NADP-dependent oxidoreductase domain-containing protein n=1 Tax=Culex pipiens pipiens TaxID=38569 RepID=A0ABD1DHD4_CULPP